MIEPVSEVVRLVPPRAVFATPISGKDSRAI